MSVDRDGDVKPGTLTWASGPADPHHVEALGVDGGVAIRIHPDGIVAVAGAVRDHDDDQGRPVEEV